MNDFVYGALCGIIFVLLSDFVHWCIEEDSEIEPEKYVMLRGLVQEYPALAEQYNEFLETESKITPPELRALVHQWDDLRKADFINRERNRALRPARDNEPQQ